MPDSLDSVRQALDAKKRSTAGGAEYWMGRDIQGVLGYTTWENFESIVEKAQRACESAGDDPFNHFREITKMIEAGKGAQLPTKDFFLSRYACYLIAMNGDPRKPEVGTAQVYFAVQTRRQEIQDQLTADDRRLQLRDRVRKANKSLMSAAKQAGVQGFAIFQAAGYEGLYEMGLVEIKKRKSIRKNEDLLDRAGRTELAANEFRITQTEDKLSRDKINTERAAIETHKNVGREIRNAINKLGGTMPEDLAAEPSIKLLERERRKKLKGPNPPKS